MWGVVILQGGLSNTFQNDAGALASRLSVEGFRIVWAGSPPPGRCPLEAALRRAAEEPRVHLTLVIGGTGAALGDYAPDAVASVCTRLLPGLPELLRPQLPPLEAALFRGIAGVRGRTLAVNLPAGPFAVACLEVLLPALEQAAALLAAEFPAPTA